MEIKQIENKKEWEEFILKQPDTLFVQSFQYGEFYKRIGENYWIFGLYESGNLIGGALVVSVHAKRGNFLFIPYGPILDFGDNSKLKEFTDFIKKFAKENNYDFIRISPFIDDNEHNKKIFKSVGFKDAPIHILAETTWILNLEPTEEELFSKMNKNHRNLISRCQREDVFIDKSITEKALNDFNNLHDITAKRHNFHRFSKNYISEEFLSFKDSDQTLIFNGYLKDKQLDSSAIIMLYGNTAVYRHGASSNLIKQISTSYLLQWEAIKEAKRRGLKYYNFWGIAPENSSTKHPFKGITHFKKGFGGFQKDLLHCQDLSISWRYKINWLIETLRSIKRGFK